MTDEQRKPLDQLKRALEAGHIDRDTFDIAAAALQAQLIIFAEQGATVVIGDAPVTMTAMHRQSALGRYLQVAILCPGAKERAHGCACIVL